MADVSPNSIDELRLNDEKDNKQEVIPEKQTFNSSRVLNFLHRKGVTVDNWESTFNVNLAVNLMNEGKTPTEHKISAELKEADAILKKYNSFILLISKDDLMLEKDPAVVAGRLENLKTAPSNMKPEEAAKVMQAWNYFNLMRSNSWRLLQTEESLKDSRKRQMEGEKGPVQDLTDAMKDKLGDFRERWDTLPSGQKLLAGGLALAAAVMFFKSEKLKGVREGLLTGVKVLGGAWLFNKAWYLFTGDSLVDSVTGTTKGSNRRAKFLAETFKTDEKGADILSKSFVMMGDVSFIDLLEKYQQAAKSGKKTIEGTRMPAAEAFRAMELFTGKYSDVEKLKKEYAKYNPPIAFNQVITLEMSRDPDVKLQEALTSRVYDGVGDYFKRGTNYLSSLAPAAWMTKKYESWFGKTPTPAELQDFSKKFGETVKTEADVNGAIENIISDKKIAKAFVETNLAGKTEGKFGLKYRVDGDGYVYMIVDKAFQPNGDEKALSGAIQGSVENAENFLMEKYKVPKDAATKKSTPFGSVFVTSTGMLKYLVRYKI
jgi:hypothetical protein